MRTNDAFESIAAPLRGAQRGLLVRAVFGQVTTLQWRSRGSAPDAGVAPGQRSCPEPFSRRRKPMHRRQGLSTKVQARAYSLLGWRRKPPTRFPDALH